MSCRVSSLKRASLARLIAVAFGGTALTLASMSPSWAAGETSTWNKLTGTNSWNTDANWNAGADPFPNEATDTADITGAFTGNQTINLSAAITVGNINLADTNGGNQTLALANGTGGSLTFDNTGNGAALSLTAANAGTGTNTVSASITLADSLAISNLSTGAAQLTISGTVNTGAVGNDLSVDVDASRTVLMSGVISGGTNAGDVVFTKTGAGTLSLTTATNTFKGNFLINGGALLIDNNARLGDAANGLTLNGGTLQSGASITLGSGRVISIGAAHGTINQTAGTLTLGTAGQLTGSGNLTKLGGGTVQINAANIGFTGDVTIGAGVFDIRHADALGTGGTKADIALNAGTLNLRDNGTGSNGTITFGHNLTLGGTATISVDRIGGSNNGNTIALGTLKVTGDYSLTANNANNYGLRFTELDLENTARTLTKAGGALLTLSAINNAVTGNTINVTGGGLRVPLAAIPAADFAVNLNSGTAIDLLIDANSNTSSANITFPAGSYSISTGAFTPGTLNKTLTVDGTQTIPFGSTLSVSGRDDYRIELGAVNNSGTIRSTTATYRGTYLTGIYTGGGNDVLLTTGNAPPSGIVNYILEGFTQANEAGLHVANGANNTVYRVALGESASLRNGVMFVENGSTVTVTDQLIHMNGAQGIGSHQAGISLRGGSKFIIDTAATVNSAGVSGTNFYRATYGGDGNANNAFEINNTGLDFGAAHGLAGNSSTFIKLGGLNFIQHASSSGTSFSVDVASTSGRNGYLGFEGLDHGVSGASAGWTVMGAGASTDGVINVVTASASPIDGLRFTNSRFVDVQGTGQLNVATNVTTSIASGKTVSKIGTGSMNFNGAVSGTGTLSVAAGTVGINNASFSPNLAIPSGTVTGGVNTGTISTLGSLTVGATGTMTLSPASTTTNWNVGGSTTIVSGATINLNITDTAFDRINTVGALALDNGTYTLNFTKSGAGTPGGWINPVITGSSVTGGYGTFNASGLPVGYNLSANGTYGNGVFVIIDANTPTEWFPNASGIWSSNANWIKNGVNPTTPPNGVGQVALFGNNITSAQTVTLDAAQTLGTAYFLNNTASYTIDTTTAALTMQASSGNAALNVFSGTHTISGSQGVILNSTTELNVSGGASLAIANISGSNALISAGTVAISGTNTYSGATTITSGTTTLTGSLATSDIAVSNGGTLNVNSGGTFTATPTATIDGTLNSTVSLGLATATGNGTLAMAAGTTLSIGKDGQVDSNLTATITSPSAITLLKTGDSNIYLISNAFVGGTSPTTNWSGNAQIDEGMLVVTTMENQLQVSRNLTGSVLVNAGGTLGFQPTGGGINTFQNAISGNGKVRVLTGSQSLVLSGANTYTGGTELESGTEVSGSFNGTSGGLHGNISAVSGNPIAKLTLSNASGVGNDFTYDGTFNDAGGSLRVNFHTPGGVLAPNQRYVTLGGVNTMTGTLSLTKENTSDIGAYVSIPAGTATFTGNPTLAIANGTIDWTQATDASLNSVITSSASIANITTLTNDAAGRFIKRGAGNLTLASSSNIFGGILQVEAGTLTGSLPTLGGSGAVITNATFVLDEAGSGTFTKSISGSGLFTFAGGGFVTLSGTNTHTGGTRVTGGSTLTASNNSLGGTSGGLILDNGTFNASNAIAARSLLQVSAAGGTIDHSVNQVSFNGVTGYSLAGNLSLNGSSTGALNLAGGAGPVTVAPGSTITVNGGAKLTIDATAGNPLQDSVTPANRVNVVNDSSIGFDVTAGSASVGNVSGTGDSNVAAGASLTANHVRQNALSIGAGSIATIRTNGGNSGTSTVTTLSINPTGKLDLNDNDLVVDNGNLATLTAQLAAGLDINGTYGNGFGITSSAFANDPNFNTVLGIAANVELGYTSFSGQTVDANDVLIKYTYYGDADLNGSVDTSTDFDLYITGLTSGGSLGGWLYGDFDYSGTVDSSTDFDLYITGLTSQGSPLLTAGGGSNLVQAVPEPSTFVLGGLALLGFAGVGLRKRRSVSEAGVR